MYEGIKKAFGLTTNKTTPLKSSAGDVITDRRNQMERWVEHYQELYSRENTVTNAAIEIIESLPVMQDHTSHQEDGVFLHTGSDGKLFSLAHLRAKTKVQSVLIREMLFADDAALTSHSEEALQRLINCFALACRDFGLTISLKKTNMGQDVSNVHSICITDYTLEVVENFTYLGSIISSNLSLDAELNIRIGKAATMMA
ncbi:hypothetical protein SKAU_G00352440 [Synaphobranchus kaupii]|uniref:Reverse transcriptase domain-containing protein n=1 Tax=Synaphobranchus kaupii TaxID=118154 RepID=A0A9Q1EKR3_SYNKA|nr:hypothetical protein SKAU_G00352440 [Synaphobranchus kaupii]